MRRNYFMKSISIIFMLLAMLFSCTQVPDETTNEDNGNNSEKKESIVSYKVEHYQQNTNDDGYTLVKADSENKNGKAGENTSVQAKTYEGFTAKTVEQVKITADGKAVVKIYYDRNIITLTLDLDGGEGETEITGKYGATVNIAAPTKSGYDFAGWNPELPKTFLAISTTYKAKWTAGNETTYTVEHYQQNIADDEYILTETDTETGTTDEDTFAQAKTYEGFTAKSVEQAKIAADGSTVVKIYYDRNIITLTLDLDGGEGENEITGKYGATVNVTAPTKNGYEFACWNPELPTTFPAESTTYTATWAKEGDYVITYELNGGTNALNNPASYNVETATIILADATKTGYSFGGWYTDKAFKTAITEIKTGSIGAVTLYAKWNANTDTAYTVEHYQQNIIDDEYILAETDTETGTTDEDTSATAKDYAGFTAKTIEQMKIAANGSTVVKIYYDRKEITLTLNLNGGEGKTEITGKYGADATTPANPTKTGYTFAEWNPELPATLPAENVTYTASWNANTYTVKFEANGGSGTMTDQTFTYDVEQALTANTFTRKGYEFTGWATSADGEKVYDNNESVKNLTTNFDGEVTLYAQWIANKVGITVILPNDAQINLQQVTNENIVTFTAADSFDSYAWYIDGVKQIDTSNAFTIDTSTIEPANYKVMVVVSFNDEYYSAVADLEVRTN